MKDVVIVILVLVLGYAGLLVLEKNEQIEQMIAIRDETRTTMAERTSFGEGCVSWLKEEGEKEGKREGEFYLGRSWRKHGQMVFEVVVPKDEFGLKSGSALCTYDEQSGMMYSYWGENRNIWMFY
ncbi:hypothetical protein [Cereibacter changlensis]|uniref:hypothetical protein n=1 Tax=Cereibacter changlensis TaxID=402884 RepID=UPI0011B25C18|nr:hypothetical protein [Cereibacter changlensis]